jgi:DNA polymerase-3 subunit alpha
LAWEKELLGVYLSEHPFSHVAQRLASDVDAFCGQIGEEMVGHTVVTAGLVTSVRELFTKDKRPFVTAVLEDFGGSIEVTAWTEVYERNRQLWQEGNTLVVKGKVKERGDRIQLVCQGASLHDPGKAEEPAAKPAQVHEAPSHRRLRINLHTSEDVDADIAHLRQLFDVLREFPGEDEVHLSVVSDGGVTELEAPEPAGYCPELHRHLAELVDEQDLMVEERAGQAR